MLRITGGEFRGRLLRTPRGVDVTRPTQARLRQALLNSIQMKIPGARVLDLFAGSGALAIEALSRGADGAVCVENHKQVVSVLEQNREELRLGKRLQIIAAPVEASWARIVSAGPYDIIFADPPYAAGWEKKLLEAAPWRELLTSDSLFCLEWGAKKSESKELPEQVGNGFLIKTREKIYSESILTTYQHSENQSVREEEPEQDQQEEQNHSIESQEEKEGLRTPSQKL